MPIKDLMTKDVMVIRPDDTLVAAAKKMSEEDIGFIPVCDGEQIVGALTDRDITVRATAEGRDPNETKVSDVMSKDIFWCYEDEDIERISNLMKEKQVRRVIVVDRNKKLCGVVALGDLAREQEEQSQEVLGSVSQAPPTH